MLVVFSALLVFIIITLVIVIHELGHFLVARLFNIKVLRFSVGFGKPIFCIKGKTQWVISRIPLGGYVKMLDEREGPVSKKDRKFAFNLKPIWIKSLVVIAGPIMNGVLAIIFFTIVFWIGLPHKEVIVGEVIKDSPVYIAGVKSNDKITFVGSQKVNEWIVLNMQLLKYLDKQEIPFTIQRNDKSISIKVSTKRWLIDPLHFNILTSLGIEPKKESIVVSQFSGLSGVNHAFERLFQFVTFDYLVLWKLLTGSISIRSLMGPFGFLDQMMTIMTQPFVVICSWIGVLSIAIMVVNLLPIPGLDGGHGLFFIIEAIRRKPVSISIQVLLYRLSFIAFCVFLAQIIINDLLRYLT